MAFQKFNVVNSPFCPLVGMPELKKKNKKKSGKSNWTSFNAKRSAEREAERERKKNMESQPLQDDTTEAHEEEERKGSSEEVMEAQEIVGVQEQPTEPVPLRMEQPGFCIGAFFPTAGCIACDTGMHCPGIRHSAKCLRQNIARQQPDVLLDDDMAEFR